MTDFLSNLAARTLNLMPVIQPRPLTAFEPWPSEGALGARRATTDMPLDMTTFDATPDRSTSSQATNSPAHVASDHTSSRFNPTMSEAFDQATPSIASAPPRSDFPARSVQHPDAAASPTLAPLIEQSMSSTIMQHNASPAMTAAADPALGLQGALHLVERVIVEREQTDREPEKPQAMPAAPQPEAGEQKIISHAAVPSIIQPVVERVIDRREGIAPLNRSSDVRSSASVMPTNEAPQESPAPPVIHVTIGRVEVRATPPPAPSSRVARQTSTLSLEEYLRSRNGGRR